MKRSNTLSAVTYAVGDLLTKGAKFLLLPLYLAYLTPEQIGALAILQSVSLGMAPMFTNGISMAITRFYQEYEPRSEQLVATLLAISLAISTIGTSLFAAAYFFLPSSPDSLFTPVIVLAWLFSGFLRANSLVLERRYMIRGEALRYRTLTFTQFAFSTAIIFPLVIFTESKLLGIAIGEILAYGATLFYLSQSLLRKFKPNFGMIRTDIIWKYTYPLAIHAIFIWALSYADRFVLGRYVGLKELGTYHIGCLAASVIPTIGLAIKNAWLPDFFRFAERDRQSGAQFASWIANYYTFMLAFSASAICIVPSLIKPFVADSYQASFSVMKLVIIAMVFQSLMTVLLNPLYIANRTKTVASITGLALFVNVTAMFALIPSFGIFGAAVASVFAYAVAALGAYWEASKEYALNAAVSKIFFSTAWFGVIVAANIFLTAHGPTSLLWNIALLAIYIAVILLMPKFFLADQYRRQLFSTIHWRRPSNLGI